MPRSGVTYEQVASAAERLRADNKKPSMRTIREIIGGGSNLTFPQKLKP